jgi:hypothetical protein
LNTLAQTLMILIIQSHFETVDYRGHPISDSLWVFLTHQQNTPAMTPRLRATCLYDLTSSNVQISRINSPTAIFEKTISENCFSYSSAKDKGDN